MRVIYSGNFPFLFTFQMVYFDTYDVQTPLKIVAHNNRSRHHFSQGPLEPPNISVMEALHEPSPYPQENHGRNIGHLCSNPQRTLISDQSIIQRP